MKIDFVTTPEYSLTLTHTEARMICVALGMVSEQDYRDAGLAVNAGASIDLYNQWKALLS